MGHDAARSYIGQRFGVSDSLSREVDLIENGRLRWHGADLARQSMNIQNLNMLVLSY